MRAASDDRAERLGGRVAGLTLLLLLVAAVAAYLGIWLWAGDRAPRNAAVEGVAVGGLSAAEATAKLRGELAEREGRPIRTGFGDGRQLSLDPEEVGLEVDYAKSAAAAGAGRSLRPQRIWDLVTGGSDRHATVAVDEQQLDDTLDRLDEELGDGPVEGDVEFRGGEAIPVRPRAGTVIDRERAIDLLSQLFLHRAAHKLPTRVEEPQVDQEAVQQALRDFGRPAMSGPVVLVLGDKRVTARPRLFGKALSMEPDDGRLVPVVDGERMLKALGPVLRKVGSEPRDARIVVRNGKPVVVPARPGIELDPDEIERDFADAAVRSGADRRLEVEGTRTQPELTTKEARGLGVRRRVSTFTTYFPYAEYRNVNLTRAAELINGTLLRPGETFSLNETVGERTRENGFVEGYIVSDGIFKKDLGGGVSQIATTTFNAMFFAGLKDVEHKPHSVYISRYPEGREATVAWPSVDLRFTNNTPHGVLITASVRKSSYSAQGAATVSMYSTKRWDIGSRTGPRTNYRAPQVRYLQTADCEPATGVSGFDVTVYRDFRRPGSKKVVRTEKFHTHYIANDTVRCGPPPQPATSGSGEDKPKKPSKPRQQRP